MAIDNFIPAVWAGSILRNLHKNHVYGQAGVVNRDYEGDIKDFGNTVQINAVGPVTIGNYVKNTNITDPQALTGTGQTLTIDQAKYFNFQVDDIDAAQTKPKVMAEGTYEAAYALSDTSDQFLAGFYTSVAAGNTIGTSAAPVVVTPTTAYQYLVNLKTLLDQSNCPRQGRWVVVPFWFEGMLLNNPLYVSFGTPASRQSLEEGDLGNGGAKNGQIGRTAGFDVLTSNNVPNVGGAQYQIIAGHPIALTFAEQISKVEAYRPPLRFADALKGLHLYGAKLVRPGSIAVLTANSQ